MWFVFRVIWSLRPWIIFAILIVAIAAAARAFFELWPEQVSGASDYTWGTEVSVGFFWIDWHDTLSADASLLALTAAAGWVGGVISAFFSLRAVLVHRIEQSRFQEIISQISMQSWAKRSELGRLTSGAEGENPVDRRRRQALERELPQADLQIAAIKAEKLDHMKTTPPTFILLMILKLPLGALLGFVVAIFVRQTISTGGPESVSPFGLTFAAIVAGLFAERTLDGLARAAGTTPLVGRPAEPAVAHDLVPPATAP